MGDHCGINTTSDNISCLDLETHCGEHVHEEEYLRPILVGYAFGPKKMTTMGVVMAEASRALNTVRARVVGNNADGRGEERPTCVAKQKQPQRPSVPEKILVDDEASQSTVTTAACSSLNSGVPAVTRLTSAALERKDALHRRNSKQEDRTEQQEEEDGRAFLDDVTMGEAEMSSMIETESAVAIAQQTDHFTFSIANGPGSGNGGIRNIIRFFQKNCSSAASFADSSITANTMGAASKSCGCSVASMADEMDCKTCTPTKTQAVRVSFVPLDLDCPLEEQHGGKFDAILHKMTEDILYLSKQPSLVTDGNQSSASVSAQARRVRRLTKYKAHNPQCCLVDHPTYVVNVMSRSQISHILSKCLSGVTTLSGIEAGAPEFVVVQEEDISRIDGLVNGASFTYPMIVKPLPAAGTKASHHMMVVLNERGLRKINFPCILQEYANHNGVLYKVYVLGDIVKVFPRTSLPNLPKGERTGGTYNDHPGYVEFDSQRPYPKLSDFGVDPSSARQLPPIKPPPRLPLPGSEANNMSPLSKKRRVTMQDTAPRREEEQCKARLANAKLVTGDEIRPIATALRSAFGLELFGFDILITDKKEQEGFEGEKEMLVVDVNYFPSYKEMSNFPTLLAQYLTQRAVEGRMKRIN